MRGLGGYSPRVGTATPNSETGDGGEAVFSPVCLPPSYPLYMGLSATFLTSKLLIQHAENYHRCAHPALPSCSWAQEGINLTVVHILGYQHPQLYPFWVINTHRCAHLPHPEYTTTLGIYATPPPWVYTPPTTLGMYPMGPERVSHLGS